MSEPESSTPTPAQSQSFARSIKLVAWSFLGIRSRQGYQQDLAKVNPLHVMLVAVIGVLLLVGLLIVLVNWVVAT